MSINDAARGDVGHEKEVGTDEKLAALVARFEKATEQPIIAVEFPDDADGGDLALTASKLGGIPYLGPDDDAPLDAKDTMLHCLAQIDCADLPPLAGVDVPTSGLLQFWIGRDPLYGADVEQYSNRANAVVYHPEIDPSVTEADVLRKYTAEGVTDEDFSPLNQMDESVPLAFTATTMCATGGDECDPGLDVVTEYNAIFPDAAIDSRYDMDADHLMAFYRDATASHIGGYARFAQDDPRDYASYGVADRTITLLSLDSEGPLMWGDMGIGNWLISPEALAARDFDQVTYTWDCG